MHKRFARATVAGPLWVKDPPRYLVGFLPKFWFLRLAVRPAGGRGGAPEIGLLGALFFPRASLFSNFLRTLARSSRAYLFVIVSFLGWPSIFLFSGGSAQLALGRPLDRFSAAGSRVLPCETRAAAEG